MKFARLAHVSRLGLAAVVLMLGACDSDAPAKGAEAGAGRADTGAGGPATTGAPAGSGSATQDPGPPAPIAPTGPHPFDARDLLAMDRISSISVSPDQKRVAFVRRTTDLAANKGRTDIWVLELASGELRQLTRDPAADFDPQWAPDGQSVVFLSTRSGSSQVWRAAVDGSGSVQVSELPVDVANLQLGPDGKTALVSADVFVDCEDLACTAKRLEAAESAADSGQRYDRLFVRHWDTWKDGRRSHLFALSLDSGQAKDLTAGMDADVPSKPFGGSEEFTFSPDAKQVVFAARDAGRSEPWSTNFDLYVVPSNGSSPPKKITGDNPAWDTHPVFSPDGKRLAWLAMERAGFEADRFRLVVQDWPEGSARVVTQAWDRSISDFVFDPSGDSVLAVVGDTGHTKIVSIDLESGDVTPRVETGHNVSPRVVGEQLLYLHDDLAHPAELWAQPNTGGEAKALTHLNDVKIERAQRGDYEAFSFKGAGGDTVHGWLIKPADFDPAKRYPLAFLIHGGPQGSFSNRFHYRWNPQTYAGAGYVAVMIDFHGSTGYGQAFTDAIRGDWGGKPLEDLQKGLAHVLGAYPFIDADRMCALGASYGGYMVNWIAGNWPQRFACLVNHDGIFDNRMMYYATEELWFPEWEHGGPYHENPAGYEKHNPAAHVAKWTAPMLVIHGALDHRVPLEQGLATFTALQRRNIESRFLYFPDENHWVLKPANSLRWHDEVLRWLDEHTRAQSAQP